MAAAATAQTATLQRKVAALEAKNAHMIMTVDMTKLSKTAKEYILLQQAQILANMNINNSNDK